MQYIVQTAIVSYERNPNEPHGRRDQRVVRSVRGKVTIPCQGKTEATALADTLVLMPDRIAFAGVEMYTEGGVKVLLSFRDLEHIATQANEVFSANQ
jgi:hypothetical protein